MRIDRINLTRRNDGTTEAAAHVFDEGKFYIGTAYHQNPENAAKAAVANAVTERRGELVNSVRVSLEASFG